MRVKILLGTLVGFMGLLNAQNEVLTRVDGGSSWQDPIVHTAGTGISISNGTITNTSVDRTVTLTGAGATTVTGTYPNFTITSTDANTTYRAGTGISISGGVISNTGIVSLLGGDGVSMTTIAGITTITLDVNNGLNIDALAERLQLGGNLTEETTITHGAFDLIHDLNNTGDFMIRDNLDTILTVNSLGDVVINDDGSGTTDFRVESDDHRYMLFVDASTNEVGINDLTPDATLDVGGSFRLDDEFFDADGDAGTAGQVLTSTGSGTDWQSSFIGANVEPASNQTINTFVTTLSLTDVVFDVGGNYSTTTSRFIVPTDGYYRIDYSIWVAYVSASEVSLVIRGGASGTTNLLNSHQELSTTGIGVTVLSGSQIVEASANDEIHLLMGTGSGTATIVTSLHNSHVSYTKL